MASALIVISLVPQAIKSWKTKSTHDISLWRYVIYVLGTVLFLFYGILIVNGPIVVVNAVALVLAVWILYFKIRYK